MKAYKPKKTLRTYSKTISRLEADRILNSRKWRKKSKSFLFDNPLCENPSGSTDCKRAASQVHHKIDRIDRPDLAFVDSNLMSLCRRCHSRITKERQDKGRNEDLDKFLGELIDTPEPQEPTA